MMITNPHEIIKSHNAKILHQIRPVQKACLLCDKEPDFFRLHERRSRYVLFVEDRQVIREEVWLLRFYCSECKRTFTEYPDFVMPHKHYVAGTLAALGHNYVQQAQISYRKAVTVDQMPISRECKPLEALVADACARTLGIEDNLPQPPAEEATLEKLEARSLSHSTLWRLIGFWGSKTAYLRQILELLGQRCSIPDLFRKLQFVADLAKYRSAERKSILETFARLCIVANEYFIQFGRKIFPHFETQLLL